MWGRQLFRRHHRRRHETQFLRVAATEVLEQRSLLSALTVQLSADRDNTLYDVIAGDVSNGHGQYIVTGGATGAASARRGLLSFDIASAGIPSGSTILDVVLSMNLAESIGGTASVSVNKLLKAWGEAGSDAPGNEFDGAAAQQFDATWLFSRFDGTAWTNAGGDFSGSSGSVAVSSLGIYEWIGGGLIGDVQQWLDSPVQNFGWLIKGSEVSGNVKAFDSRDSANAVLRPKLEITYEEPVQPSIVEGRKFHDLNADGIRISPTVANLGLQFQGGNDFYNLYGGQEYWYRSQANSSWYILTPSGQLTKWNGQAKQLTGQVVESLDPHVWYTPSVLTSTSNTVAVAEPWMNGFSFELVNGSGAVVATTISRDVDRNNDGIIQPESEAGWYRFEGVGPGTFTVREISANGWTQSASRTSPAAPTAYSLDTTLGLKYTGSYHENYGGRGELWLGSTGASWYYVTPIGDLYKWNGQAVSAGAQVQGTLVDSLGMQYYTDPSLIWAAANPTLTVTSGTVVRAGDVGNFQPGVISGRKWNDVNVDGVRNSGGVYTRGTEILLTATKTTLYNGVRASVYQTAVHFPVNGGTGQGGFAWDPVTRAAQFATNGGVPGTSNRGTQTVTLPGIVESTPEAVAAFLFADETWLNGWSFELLNDRGYVVATTVSADRDLNKSLSIEPEQERGWYLFQGVVPGNYTLREVQQDGWVQVSPARVEQQKPLADLQSQYGFKSAKKDSYNFGGLNERWFQSRTNAWYYITPTGKIFAWDNHSGGTNGPARGTQIAQVSGSIYVNLNLLFAPTTTNVTVVDGSVINDRYFGNHHLLDGVFSSLAGQIH
ncbi:MAG TPA: DNRLRE domain-containing protein [Planctomycetaceae bacterium]|nr:DNRLRE domain-containing protein [Planctomycetaceae bacterium]HQZ66546.1 DNRLRE domain-containing protein [Planctomycetaceae bacterium]